MNEASYRQAEKTLWDSVGLQPAEHVVTLPRLGVKVRVQEVGQGEPVLFIHGGPNSGSTWAPLVEHLAGFRCLLVDRPGTGLSEPYAIDRSNIASFGDRFVGDVLSALGLTSAHIVASSFGGMLALRSAAAEPRYFNRMVQMAAPAMAPGSSTPPFMRVMAIRPLRWLISKLPPNERANNNILRQIGHGASLDAEKIPQIFSDWYLALQRYTDTMQNDGALIEQFVSVRGFSSDDDISDAVFAGVTAPTLFLWGADDGFGGQDVDEGVVRRMPNAELVMLPDSGHLPWLDDPRAIALATERFLNLGQVGHRKDVLDSVEAAGTDG